MPEPPLLPGPPPCQVQSKLLDRALFKRTLSLREQAQLLQTRALHLWHDARVNTLDERTFWPTPTDMR